MKLLSHYVFFFLFLLASSGIWAQQSDSLYHLYRIIPVKGRHLTSDKLQQIYVITPENELVKYSAKGRELFRFNNNYLGKLEGLDVSNPFHLVLYYPDYSTLLTLDRTLSLTGTYNLLDLNFRQNGAVGLAYDNSLWIYDDVDYRLRKYNHSGEIVLESDDLGSTVLSHRIAPVSIIEQNNEVYLNDPEAGIFVFDIFGQYQRRIPLRGLEEFQIRNGLLFYQQNDVFYVWQMESGISRQIDLPFELKEGVQVRLEQNRFYTLDAEGVKIYQRMEK